MTQQVEVAVYEPDGSTLITVLPRRDAVRWLDEHNGVGTGQFEMHLDDAVLATYPEILTTPFNVVKVRPLTVTDPVFAWQLEDVEPVRASEQEKAGHRVTCKGRDVISILDSAPLLGDGDQRVFDFSSPDGPWKVDADWIAPVGVEQGSDPTARANNPREWPDPAAEWIWSSDPTSSVPAERNWFRGEFTLAVPTDVTIWASGDNSMSLRLNGVVLATTDVTDLFAWRKIVKVQATLPAGDHLVAAWVDNAASTGNNPGAFLCVVGTTDTLGNLATVLTRTDTIAWEVHDSTNPPGWHAAQVLVAALTEAQADGYIPNVTWDFTDTLDSDGQAWDDLQAESFAVGTSLLSLVQKWAGTVYDVRMTPDLVLQLFKRRGSDVSGSVSLQPGVNVTRATPTARYGPIRNVALVRHETGWLEVVDSASVAAYGKRAVTLQLGNAGSSAQAEQDAGYALEDLANPVVTLPVSGTSVIGPQPYDDFSNGDTVSAPALLSGQADARVMSIAMVELDTRIDWAVELYPEV